MTAGTGFRTLPEPLEANADHHPRANSPAKSSRIWRDFRAVVHSQGGVAAVAPKCAGNVAPATGAAAALNVQSPPDLAVGPPAATRRGAVTHSWSGSTLICAGVTARLPRWRIVASPSWSVPEGLVGRKSSRGSTARVRSSSAGRGDEIRVVQSAIIANRMGSNSDVCGCLSGGCGGLVRCSPSLLPRSKRYIPHGQAPYKH